MASTTTSTSLVPAATYPSIVGQVLADFRSRSDLSQGQVGAVAGLQQAAWSKIERGLTAVNVEQLALVAAEIGVRPWQILRAADDAADLMAEQGVKIEPKRMPKAVKTGAVLISAAAIGALAGAAMAGVWNTGAGNVDDKAKD